MRATLQGEIRLEDLAKAGGVLRFHITRAFGAAMGYSVMRYVRGRRLSEAARALSNGAPDILSVALDAVSLKCQYKHKSLSH